MSIQKKNEYQVTLQDESSKVHLASDMRTVAADLETDENPITQITRKKVGVTVSIPDIRLVAFSTQVAPQAAIDAGCLATPSAYEVLEGTNVIFQALPVGGYHFVGWWKDGVLAAEPELVEIAVAAPLIDGDTAVYEARFDPDV
jgi:hypothetical protein